ncbi:hypothetical protein GAG84_26335 [Bacteroides thetaiotaomicron]|nr:hypothetical protein GAG84_26335 [Bacteroides thetaiotaomicron]
MGRRPHRNLEKSISGEQLISRAAEGTPPLVVSSSTAVPKLNADLLDGHHAAYFTEYADKALYQQAVDAGYTGTEAAFYAALVTLKDAPFLSLRDGGVWVPNRINIGASDGFVCPGMEGSFDADGSNAIIQLMDGPSDASCRLRGVADPTEPTDAAPKSYVDAETAKCLPKSGGTMTGPICFSEGGAALIWHLDCGVLAAVPEDQVDYASPDFANLGVATPVEWFHAANKDYVDKKTLVFTGKTVATTAWAANSTYSAQGYGFRAAVACAGVTTSHRPDVAFGAADSVGGNFAPFCESYAGGVYIYCKTKPTATITIPSIVCVKGA